MIQSEIMAERRSIGYNHGFCGGRDDVRSRNSVLRSLRFAKPRTVSATFPRQRMKLKYLILILLIFLAASLESCQNIKSGNYFEAIGDLKLNFTIRGNGPVMLAGHPNSGKIGYELSLRPLEKHFTMVYYEPRGTGRSEPPETVEEYNQSYLVEEIEGLRKHLKTDKIWIFGHSDQSAVALEYALKYPNSISGLIITGASLIGTQQESADRRKEFENQRAEESGWFAQVIAGWEHMEKNKTDKAPDGNDISASPIKWWCFNEESSQKVIPVAKEISKAGRRKPIGNQSYYETPEERQKYLEIQKGFTGIQTKTLIINGKFDTNNPPKYAEELHKVLPNSELVLIEKAGHFPWIESADETFYKIEQWLDQNK